MALNIKYKMLIVSSIIIVVSMGSAYISRSSTQALIDASDELLTINTALRNHMEGDMMHDAIRGDMLSVMYALETNSVDDLEAIGEDVKEHTTHIEEMVHANEQLVLPEDIKKALADAIPDLNAYTASARSMYATALEDKAKAQAMYPDFKAAFSRLEEKLGALSDLIHESATKLQESNEASVKHTMQLTLLMSVASLLLLASLPVMTVMWIFKPLNRMMECMKRLTQNELHVDVPYTQRRDEMGNMASTVQVFKENALQVERMTKEREQQKEEAEQQKRAALNQMADTFERSVKDVVSQVASSASQMRSGAESVTFIAEDTKARSNRVVNTSSEAAHTSSQVAAAAEELTASIKEISMQTQRSSEVATAAAGKAEFAKHCINQLAEKSHKVGQIIEMITGIAGQINLLALNATIESARAGDAGKGFAVVASEVKNLASQVAKATDEISQQITDMQNSTKTSVDSVMDILGIIGQVSQGTSAVAAAVEEQSAVTDEIARNVNRTSTGTQEISQNMANVQEGAEKTGATAREVLESAQHLNAQSEMLKQRVDEFLRTIRAA